jgi:hypothetical protein
MLEKLTDFLKEFALEQKESEQFDQLWKEKREYINLVYMTFCKHYGAALTGYGKKFQNHLEAFSFPSSSDKEPDRQWTEFWLKSNFSAFLKDDAQVKIFKSFLSPGYYPPNDLFDLMGHLLLLQIYYHYFVQYMPLSITSRIDLVFTKLAQPVWIAIDSFPKAVTNKFRTDQSGKSQRKKVDDIRDKVLSIYKEKAKNNPVWEEHLSESRKANIIQNDLAKLDIKRGESTIRKDLQNLRKLGLI